MELIRAAANRHRQAIDIHIGARLAVSLSCLNVLGGDAGDLANDGKVIDTFRPWLATTRKFLLENGTIIQRDDRYIVNETVGGHASQWDQEKTAWLADPCQSASVRLVERCLDALPDILIGRRTTPEVMFSDPGLALVESIYKNNPIADFFNDALSGTLLQAIRVRLRHDPMARIRLLEVGGGTGGATGALLQQLACYRDHIEEYRFTDVSRSFLAHAQQHYAPGNAFLTTAMFNVEEPAAEQGIAPDYFDFVIASNVLHATRNIARTLRNIKFALRARGILLLNELTRRSLVTHVTFGLLGGWWRVEDAELRNEGSPSLPLEHWRAVLLEEGYRGVLTPVQAVETDLGQQIIAAESDGVVRQEMPVIRPAPVQAGESVPTMTRTPTKGPRTPADSSRNSAERPARVLLNRETSLPTRPSQECALEYVTGVLSQALKLEEDLIDPEESLGNYGIDSILIGQLTHTLQKDFERVTTTLFFEKSTAAALAEYLASTYPEELRRVLEGGGRQETTAAAEVAESVGGERAWTENGQAGSANERKDAALAHSLQGSRAGEAVAAEGIAIIGLSGRYPRAASIAEYWENLKQGRDCITEIPGDRWPLEGFYEPDPDTAVAGGCSYSKWGGFLTNIRAFDPMFFNISPREAVGIDPQERLFLMSCWELIEDAGYTRASLAERYASRVGVFVGVTRTGFELFGPPLWARGERTYPRTSFSSAANRVSYFLDLSGPSLAIDTMCSSSLVAIHEACMHLRTGACELAIAGGVNVYVHPSSYVGLCAARMLSPDGRCRAFGDGANGFVPGEGVGAVLLKPLRRAIADADRIYAVITGTSVNHGGKTNGFTVPNPGAQRELIETALAQAGVPARSIGYLESHGTGTELGDPIEIAGLSEAFRRHTSEVGYCRIGSVKSNIGHLEAAAGIAGLTKIVLQLQHGVLVPSLHAEQPNANIRFEETPFVLQRRLEPWDVAALKSGSETRKHRVAGISSFGAGGANAHLIVEEYISVAPTVLPQPAPVVTPQISDRAPIGSSQPATTVIVLSARTRPQLERMAFNLCEHLKAHERSIEAAGADTYLGNLAYTLQVGREAMEERLGLLVNSLPELLDRLETFLPGRGEQPGMWIGRIQRARERRGSFASDRELEQAVEGWLTARRYRELLDVWLKGVSVDWRKLYSDNSNGAPPRRIGLPAYPFSLEPVWFGDGSPLSPTPEAGHCTTTLSGSEFYLSDHLIRGKKILPAAAYLEMARAALSQSLQIAADGVGLRLRQVVWPSPMEVGTEGRTVHLTMSSEGSASRAWEIHSQSEAGRRTAHARGIAEVSDSVTCKAVSIEGLAQQMHRGVLSAAECYHAFDELEVHYGPAHRGIRRILVGERQLLAELELPAAAADTAGRYGLHPALLDSALQSGMGMQAEFSGGRADLSALRPMVPFALGELQILGRCVPRMFAWVREADPRKPLAQRAQTALDADCQEVTNGSSPVRLDIDLFDGSGAVALRLRGFAVRPLDSSPSKAVPVTHPTLLRPQWLPVDPDRTSPLAGTAPLDIVVCGRQEIDVRELQSLAAADSCISVGSDSSQVGEQFTECALAVFRCIKQRSRVTKAGRMQVLIPDRTDDQPLLGLLALLNTATLECRGLSGQILIVPSAASAAELAAHANSARALSAYRVLRFRDDQPCVLSWEELPDTQRKAVTPWRQDGVYLITGGGGGLAKLLVAEIKRTCPNATIFLCGRRAEPGGAVESSSPASRERRGTPGQVLYRSVDVTRYDEVESLIAEIVADYGGLHGIIHAAGIHLDRIITNKDDAEFREVLAPKVAGAVHLDLASADVPLDFLAFWSSGAAIFGNVGQADYAAGNAFMDQFAHWRNRLAKEGRRTGRTLSLNWPQWEGGGMRLSAAAQADLFERFGLRPLAAQAGFEVFCEGLHGMDSQLLVVTGNKDRVMEALSTDGDASATVEDSVTGDPRKARSVLRRTIATVLKLREEDIENDAEFGDLGFDSVLLTELAQALNRQVGLHLDPTVFFDYPVLEDFASYLAREFPEAFASSVEKAGGPDAQEKPVAVQGRSVASAVAAKGGVGDARAGTGPEAEPIAIIGMSAEFPLAPDLETFWRNLVAGRDCIREIPEQRWSWEALFGDPRTEPNRTNIKWGGFIDGAASFDPLFFSISPREAQLMDPQQRLLMTHAYLAIEEAGYDAAALAGSNTGIFVGTGNSGYGALAAKAGYPVDAYSATAVIPSVGPNRLSFFLDLHGPSEPVETACSSALVAIHQAVSAIRSGRCDAAIAGGVMTIVTPDGHVSFSKAGMLSVDGRCKAFSAHANGYVRGEGVGMLLLKPLRTALAEGAHIHGLIRASAVNHGGRATSLTAPNAKAQAELLKSAYREAAVDPRTVSYIETHGTGTPLGDPIEVNGLKAAFKDLYARAGAEAVAEPRCGLGSVKSNIGHLEMAAGVAGVIKVLLQLKHRTLVKTLHCEEQNPYIDLAGTPFYLVTENQHWPAVCDERGAELPRRAGVSSFGFGGVNAHVVLEEFVPAPRPDGLARSSGPALIPLSARTPEQLQEAAANLLRVLEHHSAGEGAAFAEGGAVLLEDLAFTLQVGRTALEQRLAFIVSSIEDLKLKLQGYLVGPRDVDGLYTGRFAGNTEALAWFREDEELREAVDKWCQRHKLGPLAQLWVSGASVDWQKLHPQGRRRLTLPGYPFAKEQYWIADAARVNGQSALADGSGRVAERSAANPFLHVNTSDLSGFRVTVTLSGTDRHLADHVVRGQRMLPGVAYLEMIRAAVVDLAGDAVRDARVELRELVWLRPLLVPSTQRRVHVRLIPGKSTPAQVLAGAPLQCEVTAELDEGQPAVHVRCWANLLAGKSAEPPRMNLAELRGRMSRAPLKGVQCYERLESLGLSYGATYRAIQILQRGQDEALAQLSLPPETLESLDRFVLHPTMADAALQSALGLGHDAEVSNHDGGATSIPFAVRSFVILRPCVARMWAWVRRSLATSPPSKSPVVTIDVDLLDDDGVVCACARGLTSKTLEPDPGVAAVLHTSALQPTSLSDDGLLYGCRLTGTESFVADHLGVVPGVAYLEMIRAVAASDGNSEKVSFRNVVWPEPLTLTRGPTQVQIRLQKQNAHADFEIVTGGAGGAPRSGLHAQGTVNFACANAGPEDSLLDLPTIQARCPRELAAADIHALLADAPHGSSMMPLERLHLGTDEALATVRMPAGLTHVPGSFELYPSLMHGAVLSAVLLALTGREGGAVELPFSIEALDVRSPLPSILRVHVVRRPSAVRSFSIQLADSQGRICVSIQGLSTVPMKSTYARPETRAHTPAGAPVPSADSDFQARICHELIDVVAGLQKIDRGQVRADVELSKYGLDSLGLTELSNVLNQRYQLGLMPTVFFEHSTLGSLAGYLASVQGERLRECLEPPAGVDVDSTPPNTGEPVDTSGDEAAEVLPPPGGLSQESLEPLAVVGMSARLPGAADLTEFWQSLEANADLVSAVPASRWDRRQRFGGAPDELERPAVQAAGFIQNVECFDSLFFGISPREAEAMDPQQRLFLETAWSCIEDAGYRSADLSHSRTGVFVGVSTSDYRDLCLLQRSSQEFAAGATFHFEVANRVSYVLNLRGPSEVLDTACSSSLIALHRAIESLRAGSCDAALVGGVNLIANPYLMNDMSGAGMLSPDGRCKTFDRRADGYGRGEGVAAILLKPLSRAQADGDHIYGLIRGSAENHGGRATSPTAPNPSAQADLLVAAYTRANIPPSTVSYIETHGTGTSLGDPVEINGLKSAFARLSAAFVEDPTTAAHCALGTVKTNIGHLEAAAGIAALIKVLLMLRHRRIPGNGQLRDVNPYVSLEGSPFYLARQSADWMGVASAEGPLRRAGISSFGVGGSNAHVILEEFVARRWGGVEEEELSEVGSARSYLITLSARTFERLTVYANRLGHDLESEGASCPALRDIAYTLQIGRDALSCRVALVVDDIRELIDKLRQLASGTTPIDRCWRGEVARDAAEGDGLQPSGGVTLEVLAQHWVAGGRVHWLGLYAGRTSRRLSLPTYPFALERHWLPAVPQGESLRDSTDIIIAAPMWTPLVATPAQPEPPLWRLVVLCQARASDSADRAASAECRQIEQSLAGSRCFVVNGGEESPDACFTAVAGRLFEQVQETLRHQIGELPTGQRLLMQVVVREDLPGAGLAALAALLKSAHQENPAFLGQTVLAEPTAGLHQIVHDLRVAAATPMEPMLRFRQGRVETHRWREVSPGTLEPSHRPLPWKSRGVYLITGGMGGLGRIFAQEILDRVSSAIVVLVGRSRLDGERQEELTRLRQRGEVVYEQADVCDEQAVQALIRRIQDRYGSLQGILHAAGLLHDNYILNKSRRELEQVLAPKVAGTMNLDRATRLLDLDFFILFSSGTGTAGNAGQADYALANAFMDEYARYRNEEVAAGRRSGRALSCNWSVWQDGGMKVDAALAAQLREQLGIVPMDTASALAAFYRGLECECAQVLLVAGEVEKLVERVFAGVLVSEGRMTGDAAESLAQEKAEAPPGEKQATDRADDASASLSERVEGRLRQAISRLIKVPESALGSGDRLEEFGLDSMMVTRLSQRLGAALGPLPKTLFYEHRTLASLAGYLVRAYHEACVRWVGSTAGVGSTVGEGKAGATDAVDGPLPEVGVATARGYPRKTVLPVPAKLAPIAVIGLSGRYPHARDLDELWDQLRNGKSGVGEIPVSRWGLEGFYHPDVDEAAQLGRSYSKWGAFLEDVASFDPLFFNMSARDAAGISPQERLFLESCWHAMEDAGYCPSSFSDVQRERIGVYGAVTKTQANTSFAALVNRVSFFMDLRGPSVPVDTKCSSTLVALHQACQALAREEIDMAIVGAVNLYLDAETYRELSRMRLLADSPAAAVYATGGLGFIPGEGVGAVVLKRLTDARSHNDGILALIRATAVNHNGRTLNFGVPSPERQAAAIQHACAAGAIDPDSITYIETAANGSEMGDAIEIRALTMAFAKTLERRAQPPRIGSLKPAMGHGEAASGMAQLTKVVLQLQHKMLCPTVVPADRAAGGLDTGPFELQRAASEWVPRIVVDKALPRRAGIHSTGAGGVNAHAIVEEYIPELDPLHAGDTGQRGGEGRDGSEHGPVLFTLSTKSESAYRSYLQAWRRYLLIHPDVHLQRLAYTVQRGREAMKHRFACVADNVETLTTSLEQALQCAHGLRYVTGTAVSNEPRVRPSPALFTATDNDSPTPADDLMRLARLWVAGATVDWSSLYPGRVPQPLNGLPVYPFSRKTYGVEPAAPEVPRAVAATVKDVRHRIRAVINELLAFEASDEIDMDTNFAEMGFDSVSIVTFVEGLARIFNLELEVTAPFNYPCIRALADHISGRVRPTDPPNPDSTESLPRDGPSGVRASTVPPAAPILSLDSLLMDLAQDDLDVEQALELLERDELLAVGP